MDDDVPLSLIAVLLLVGANGFFVATEFALVAVRRTRIEQLAAQGNTNARSVLDALNHLDAYIAATQLGITMASLALGWIGEPALAHLIDPLLLAIPLPAEVRSVAAHAVSAILAFAVITTLHIVLGELGPKSLALQRTEATALAVARPIHWFHAVFRLPISALNGLGNAVVRLFGIEPAAGHALVQSAEELKLSVAASREAGVVSSAAQEAVQRALDLADLAAHHVMVPRSELVALRSDASVEHVAELVQRHQHSRFPVYEKTLDNIVGIVSAKRALAAGCIDGPVASGGVQQHMVPPVFIPENMDAYRVLSELKLAKTHVAIVIDEYGGTAGMITLRDLMERMAGEVLDESEPEQPQITWLADGTVAIDGLMLLEDVEGELGVDFGEQDVDTVGGLIFSLLGRAPSVGDVVTAHGYEFAVEELDGLRVSRIRALPAESGANGHLQKVPRDPHAR